MSRSIKGLAFTSVAELNPIYIFASTHTDRNERRGQNVVNVKAVVEGRSASATLVGARVPAAVSTLKQGERNFNQN